IVPSRFHRLIYILVRRMNRDRFRPVRNSTGKRMYWRRRTTSRIIILLLGSVVMFAEWLSSAGSGYARLRLRSNAYSSDADSVQAEAHGRGYSYFQQPYFHDELHGHSRQEPD